MQTPFFTKDDFLVFTAANSNNNSEDIKNKRQNLQKKMMKLNSKVIDILSNDKKYESIDLHCDHRPKHITSSIIYPPNAINSWILVRYGISKERLEKRAQILPEYGKLKNSAVLQFGIFDVKGFCIGFYLGNKVDNGNSYDNSPKIVKGSYDRAKIDHDRNRFTKEKKASINAAISILKNYDWINHPYNSKKNISGLKWEIGAFNGKANTITFDLNQQTDFCEWLLENDPKVQSDTESYIDFCYDNDVILNMTIDELAKEIIDKFTLLYPLFTEITNL